MSSKAALLFVFILFSFLTSFSPVLQAQQSAQVLFDEGNSQLREGNFSEALEYYRKIDTTVYVSGALFLNMGISYLNVDSLGLAKYYFMKAAQFAATRDEAEEALAYVNNQFSRQSAVLPKLPWEQAFDWLNKHMGPTVTLFTGLTLLNVGVLIFILRWFVSFLPKTLKIAGITTALTGVFIVFLSFYLSYLNQRYTQAVMVDEQTAVQEKPEAESAVISQAYEGYDFTVDKKISRQSESWMYVRMSNGQYGWIPREDIRVL